MNDVEFEKLKEVLRGHGFTLDRVEKHKRFDRVRVRDRYGTYDIRLLGKLSELSLEAVVGFLEGKLGWKT